MLVVIAIILVLVLATMLMGAPLVIGSLAGLVHGAIVLCGLTLAAGVVGLFAYALGGEIAAALVVIWLAASVAVVLFKEWSDGRPPKPPKRPKHLRGIE